MKKAYTKIILFLLTIFVGEYCLNIFLEYRYKQNYHHQFFGHLNYYLDSVDVDTLLLGNSKVLNGIIPEILGKNYYNLSFEGTDLIVQTGVIDILFQKNKLPKKVLLLNIEPKEFDKNYSFKSEISRLKYYYYSNEFIKNEIDRISTYEYLKYTFRSYRFNGIVNNLFTEKPFKKSKRIFHRGYDEMYKKENDHTLLYHNLKELKKTYVNRNYVFNNAESERYLKQIIDQCKIKKVELIFFTAPKYFFTKNEVLQSLRLANFCKKLKIPYINYYLANIKEFKDKNFWHNNPHMSKKGATFFSKRFKRDIEKIAQTYYKKN